VGKCRDARVPPSGVRVVFRHVTAIDDPELSQNEGCHLAPPSGGARGDGITPSIVWESQRWDSQVPEGNFLEGIRGTSSLVGVSRGIRARGQY